MTGTGVMHHYGHAWIEANPNLRTYLGAPEVKVVRSDGTCHIGTADHGCSAAACRDSDRVWWVVYAFPCARHHNEWARLSREEDTTS